MSEPRGRAFWESLVRQVESGKSQLEVARRYGVGSSSVGHWVRRLRKERQEGVGPTEAPLLLPVRMVGESPRRLEVAAGPFRLVFEEGTEPSYVGAVARALGGC